MEKVRSFFLLIFFFLGNKKDESMNDTWIATISWAFLARSSQYIQQLKKESKNINTKTNSNDSNLHIALWV